MPTLVAGPQRLWWNVDLMTSVVAAIVALGAGSVVAAFLYFKRSANPMGFGAFAFGLDGIIGLCSLRSSHIYRARTVFEAVLTIALDSSRSLGVSGDSLANVAVKKFEALGFDAIERFQ